MRWLAAILLVAVLAAPVPAQPAGPPLLALEAVERAVVLVSVIADSGGRPVHGSGSGIIIDASGLILTANHVVARARQITVTLRTGESFPATVVGGDTLFDTAVLRADVRGSLPTAGLGSSSALQYGEVLTAIGRSPRRSGGPTSGAFLELDLEARPGVPYLRASTTVWPGDSGGALINDRGEVVGLIVAITRDGAVSLSVAVDAIKTYLPDLRAGIMVRHPWLGVTGTTITDRLAQELGLAIQSGVLIYEVVPGGPAEQAGLRGGVLLNPANPREIPRGGDIITRIDGHSVTSFGMLAAYVLSRRIGETVTLEFVRAGAGFSATVVLGERPGI